MPGVNLNLDLPALGDPMATSIAKLVAALEAVEDDLAGKILPSEMNINLALSMNGNALTNVGSVQMLSGNAPSAAGSIYYSNGEFYAIDSSGVVRLTLNGALDITAAGGFVGDYGQPGVLAAASYDNASEEFRFYSDGSTGEWADVVCDDLVLEGANGSVRLGVDGAINTARQILVKSLPTSGVSMLVYDASTSTLEDNAVTRATNTVQVKDLDVSGKIAYPARTFTLPMHNGYIDPSSTGGVATPFSVTKGTAGGFVKWQQHLPCVYNGNRLTGVTVFLHKTDTSSADVTLYSGADVSVSPIATQSITTTGDVFISLSTGLPATALLGTRFIIEVVIRGTSDSIRSVMYSVDATL